MYSLLNESKSEALKGGHRAGVPSVRSSACFPRWTSCVHHRACPEVWAITAHNKEHKEHCSSFVDSVRLYHYITLVSIQCLKEVLQSCSTLYAFCLNTTKLQAMSWGIHPVRPINFPYPGGFVYLSVQFSLTELNYWYQISGYFDIHSIETWKDNTVYLYLLVARWLDISCASAKGLVSPTLCLERRRKNKCLLLREKRL